MGQYFDQITENKEGIRVWDCQIKCPENIKGTNEYYKNYYVGVKLMEHSWLKNKFMQSMSNYIYKNPTKLAWVGDYADSFHWEHPEGKPNPEELHKLAWGEQKSEEMPYSKFDYNGKFLVNHTHKIALSFDEYIKNSTDKDGYCVHPLSLLTACGNGLGGGDFWEQYIGASDVGLWCGDKISIEDQVPEDYTLEQYCFKEERA